MEELDVLLDIVEQIKPTGNDQWELVTADMVTNGYCRTATGYRTKFDKLWAQENPTGCAVIPRINVKGPESER